jgi:hypothetical protein
MATFTSNFAPTLKKRTNQGNIYCGFDADILTKNPPETKITGDVYHIADKQVLVLKDVFSGKECDEMIFCSELCGYESVSHIYAEDYRVCERVMIDDNHFVTLWQERMMPVLQTTHPIQQPILNPRLRISKYVRAGFFAPHYDTPIRYKEFVSNYTVLLYLNDVKKEDGGATRFYYEKEGDIDRSFRPIYIHPTRGSVVIFPHDICHDGEELYSGQKYMIRTELLQKE